MRENMWQDTGETCDRTQRGQVTGHGGDMLQDAWGTSDRTRQGQVAGHGRYSFQLLRVSSFVCVRSSIE